MPDNLLPIETQSNNQKQWSNYSLILNNKEVNVQKVNHWIQLDIMGSSQRHMSYLQEDLKKFDEFDTFNIAQINKIKTMRQVK